jgi:hypothetical protein
MTVNHDTLFRYPAQDGHRVGPFVALLAGAAENPSSAMDFPNHSIHDHLRRGDAITFLFKLV